MDNANELVERVEIGIKCGKPLYRVLQNKKWNIVDFTGFAGYFKYITPDTVFYDERIDHVESTINDYDYISYLLHNWYKDDFCHLDYVVYDELKKYDIKGNYRFNHVKKVLKLSEMLLFDWYDIIVGKKKCGGEITSECEKLVFELVENDLEWSVGMVAYLHDMFKFSDNEEHGKLAANYFKTSICEPLGLDMSYEIISLMYEALLTHSNKRLSLNNPFQRILVDADVLSKYNIETMQERQVYKYPNKSIREIFNMLDSACKDYTGKTPGFQSRLNSFYNTLVSDIRIYEIKNGIKGAFTC